LAYGLSSGESHGHEFAKANAVTVVTLSACGSNVTGQKAASKDFFTAQSRPGVDFIGRVIGGFFRFFFIKNGARH
jgi:hypothetical protein